jgi:hypothetical protein
LIRPVIFLDFDGVTHSVWDKRYFHHEILDRIDRLRCKHDAQVVVSSNWKVNYPVPELEDMIAEHSGVHLPLFEHTTEMGIHACPDYLMNRLMSSD